MGRILLYTTEGSSLCSLARAVVRSWSVPFYEISLSRHPERAAEMVELMGGQQGVPQMLLNGEAYTVSNRHSCGSCPSHFL